MTGRTAAAVVVVTVLAGACGGRATDGPPRASGFVEATDVRVTSKIGGRLQSVTTSEGARVTAGETLATVETTDLDLALRQVRAERAQAAAQLQLLRAGARPEALDQARAQVAAARSEVVAAEAERNAAETDVDRYRRLVERSAGARKPYDDAVARRNVAVARVQAAVDRVEAARATLAQLEAGARAEEIAAAEARVATVDARIASLAQDLSEAVITAPLEGVVTSRLVEPGELVAPGTPIAVIVDLDRAWASVYVAEPLVPRLTLGQDATVITDAGDRLPGRIAFISPRAEFTPRNVQTADERARLVYRVKVTVDNRDGILKPGMPVEAEFELRPAS